MDEERYLKIDDIELTPIAGRGNLEMKFYGQEKYLRWYEDWDTSAYSDEITVNLSTGDITHTYYVEDNFNDRTEQISDRNRTIQTLRHITTHLYKEPQEYQKARQTIDELVTQIKI